ncbi:hypothetical protein [Sandaracinus amylolyticus]|uniref:hypothetical protein n=1 Tax=Sandaracinus amylolyticus TaxID=927083 RepID=UPI001F305E89|nr:hypothetical protein [Sandaracinus amylolyticus]UJR82566.1 Hypothetical protein I5071_46310 [Sandaracinus amylolyticus]
MNGESKARIAVAALVLALAGCNPPRGEVMIDGGTTPPMPDAATGAQDASEPPPCTFVELEPAPADVLWVVDTTDSWESRADRYAGAIDALVEGTDAWSDAEHALLVFPRFVPDPEAIIASCEPSDYETVDLEFGASGQSMADELAGHPFDGESPLGPALEGAITIARGRAAESRWRSTHVVLVTDASPGTDEACDTTWEEVATIAEAGFDDGRRGGVHVHVMSVIGSAIPPDHISRVFDIAEAGGGYPAIVNGSRTDVARSAGNMIEDLQDRAAICTRMLPPGADAPATITLRFADDTSRTATRVADASACATAAWGFYVDDPEDPTTITLCSGPGGVGGFCEVTYVDARTRGAPRFELDGVCVR